MLHEELGLPASFCATELNPNFSRKNPWLPHRQKDVDQFEKVSVTACCWMTAGLLAVITARLSRLATAWISEATTIKDQLLSLASEADAAPVVTPRLSEDGLLNDADFAMIKAINLAKSVAIAACKDGPRNNIDYDVEGLRIGVLWVLWGEQSVYVFAPWYKHARRVIVASDKRKDAPKGRLGNLVPRHLLNMNEAVTKAAFARPT